MSRSGDLVPLGTNILTLSPGRHSIDGVTEATWVQMNLPVLAWHYEIVVLAAENHTGLVNNYKVITVYPISYTPRSIESYTNEMQYDGTWTGWVKNVTSIPPQEYDLQLVSGVRAVAKCQYFQRQDKTTAFNLCCGATSGESISNNMPVANLPVGYQPTQQRFFPAVALNGAERFPGFVVASSNGELSWTGESIPYPGYIVSFGEFLVSENSTVSL